MGVGIKIGQGSALQSVVQEPTDLNPLLERIENIEEKTSSIEAHLKDPSPLPAPPLLELEHQVLTQQGEVAELRQAIARMAQDNDTRLSEFTTTVNSLEDKLPELIERSTLPKFEEFHDRVRREMQETASQTLEAFADRIQVKVVEKITSLEGDLTRQSESIKELRSYSLKTETSLQRLLEGVESLTDKFNRKIEAPAEPAHSRPTAPSAPRAESVVASPEAPPQQAPEYRPTPAPSPVPAPPLSSTPRPTSFAAPALQPIPSARPDLPVKIELGEPRDIRPQRDPFPSSGAAKQPVTSASPKFEDLLLARPRSNNGLRVAAVAGGGLALLALGVGAVEYSGYMHKAPPTTHAANTNHGSAAPEALDTGKLSAETDLLDQARTFAQKKEYDKAEDIYRSILKADAGNAEVKRLLASVLFRQDKIDESAKVLNSISDDKQQD